MRDDGKRENSGLLAHKQSAATVAALKAGEDKLAQGGEYVDLVVQVSCRNAHTQMPSRWKPWGFVSLMPLLPL